MYLPVTLSNYHSAHNMWRLVNTCLAYRCLMVSLIIALPITDCQPKHEYQISWTSINEAKGFLRLLFYTFSRISLMQADFTPFNHEKCFQFRPQNQRQEQPTGYFKFCSYRSERIIEVENSRCIEFFVFRCNFSNSFQPTFSKLSE